MLCSPFFKQGRNAVCWSSTRLLDQTLIYFVLFLLFLCFILLYYLCFALQSCVCVSFISGFCAVEREYK